MVNEPSVVVKGTGTVNGIPDQCVMSLGLNGIAETAAEALEICSQVAAQAIDACIGTGVSRGDVQSTNLAVRDFFDQVDQKVTARIASYQVKVRVTDLADVGPVLAAVSAAVGDALQIHSLQLVVSDATRLETEARKLAVFDARKKAIELVESAGLGLGTVLWIQDLGPSSLHGSVHATAAAFANPLASMSMEPGEIATTASVTIAFSIEP